MALLHAVSGSARVSFLGIWAIEELEATSFEIGITFTLAAVAAVVTGFLGGHLLDHLGRRPLILAASAGRPPWPSARANGDALLTGLALMVIGGAVEALGVAADQAILTDLVPPEGREQAFASARVVRNLGFVAGRRSARCCCWAGGVLFAGTAVLGAIAFAAACAGAYRGAHAPEHPPERASWRVVTRPAPGRGVRRRLPRGHRLPVLRDAPADLATDTYGLDPSVGARCSSSTR